VRPLKLKPGAKHIVQPSACGMYQENPWPVHSVTPLLAPEKDAGTLGTSSQTQKKVLTGLGCQ